MQVHISTNSSRITISDSHGFLDFMKLKMGALYLSYRTLFYSILILAFLLPFVFITTAVITLESVGKCTSKADCFGRKWGPRFPRLDYYPKDPKPFYSLLVQAQSESLPEGLVVPESFDELVAEVSTSGLDAKTSVLKLKAMVDSLGQKVNSAKLQEALYRHFVSSGIPKGMHCLSLKLTTEYSSNARARQELPAPELVPHLTNNSLHHFVLATDNVLAAAVVAYSTISNAEEPWKVVFHVITDREMYAAMHAWFALNPLPPAIVEVKGVHQFECFAKEQVPILDALTTQSSVLSYYHGDHNAIADSNDSPKNLFLKLQSRSPKYISIMNHLRIYLPKLFPDLKKVIFLDDDIVVQRDLSPLFDIDMEGKVNGAVETCQGDDPRVMSKRFKAYFNFSHPLIADNFDSEQCAWAYGMNVFDLEEWRKSNITEIYHHWVNQNINSKLTLWRLGSLPPGLIAFNGKVHSINSSWHMLGLGYQPNSDIESIKKAAVIHYNGQAKPWLDIAYPQLKPFWSRFVNYSNKFIQHCNILDA